MTARALTPGRWVALTLIGLALIAAGVMFRHSSRSDPLAVRVERGPLSVTLSEVGTLRPAEALTYRSRVPGKEIEVVWLAPEGTRILEGELVARLDTTELAADLERATQSMRQAQLDVQVAEAEGQAAGASLESLSSGKSAIDADEARLTMRMAELKAAQLKKDYAVLAPLLDQGFITRDELERAAADLELAEGAAEIARRRVTILAEQTAPQDRQRAALDVAHRTNQLEIVRQHLVEASGRVQQLRSQIEGCAVRAQRPGLVVYEDNISTAPVRKVRVGDRVTPSQGLITIPEVARMLADTSVREADLHRVSPGQPAVVMLDAFPEARLAGHVVSVGTVARVSPLRPFDGKRFDLLVALDPVEIDLRPEMTARVAVKIAEVRGVLLVPTSAVFDRQGQRVVFVAGVNGVETRPVTLGQSDDMHVEIVSGLREGEWVRLTDEPVDGVKRQSGASDTNASAGRES